MAKREFLMLAHEYNPEKHAIGHWYLSEKLDGQRAFWDGGVSRGLYATDVPYANTAKDGRFVDPPRATGLWSRYGKVIHASAEWLDALPIGMNLDMELYMGRGMFQTLRTVTGSITPNVESWREVTGMVLDAPGWLQVLADGELTGPNWQGFLHRGMLTWVEERCKLLGISVFDGLGTPDEAFKRIRQARALSQAPETWVMHHQSRLPMHPDDAREEVEKALINVTGMGGEGLVLRRAQGPWVPKRTWDVLKVKKLHDDEATVTGFTWGRKTDKGSRHLGRMGALVVDYNGKRLELSGFTDEERAVERALVPFDADVTVDLEQVEVTREVDTPEGVELVRIPAESYDREGKDASNKWKTVHFNIGERVTFTYRELTDGGIPKEARYLRKRKAE